MLRGHDAALHQHRPLLLIQPFWFSFTHSLRQVHSLFQSDFCTQRNLVLPLSVSRDLSSRFLKIIQQMLTYFSLSSHHFYPSFHLSSNSVFYNVVLTQDVTNSFRLPLSYYTQDFFSSLAICNTSLFFIQSFQPIFSTLLQKHISKTFQVFLVYFPKCPNFSTIRSYAANVAL